MPLLRFVVVFPNTRRVIASTRLLLSSWGVVVSQHILLRRGASFSSVPRYGRVFAPYSLRRASFWGSAHSSVSLQGLVSFLSLFITSPPKLNGPVGNQNVECRAETNDQKKEHIYALQCFLLLFFLHCTLTSSTISPWLGEACLFSFFLLIPTAPE